MKLSVIFLFVVSTSAIAQKPVAIACNLHSKLEEKGGDYRPIRENDFERTLILDDANKTISVYDPKAIAVAKWCSSCEVHYGLNEITQSDVKTSLPSGNGPTVISYLSSTDFRLDRVKGTYDYKSHSNRLNTDGTTYSLYYDVTGVCRKTALPSLTASGTKF